MIWQERCWHGVVYQAARRCLCAAALARRHTGSFLLESLEQARCGQMNDLCCSVSSLEQASSARSASVHTDVRREVSLARLASTITQAEVPHPADKRGCCSLLCRRRHAAFCNLQLQEYRLCAGRSGVLTFIIRGKGPRAHDPEVLLDRAGKESHQLSMNLLRLGTSLTSDRQTGCYV